MAPGAFQQQIPQRPGGRRGHLAPVWLLALCLGQAACDEGRPEAARCRQENPATAVRIPVNETRGSETYVLLGAEPAEALLWPPGEFRPQLRQVEVVLDYDRAADSRRHQWTVPPGCDAVLELSTLLEELPAGVFRYRIEAAAEGGRSLAGSRLGVVVGERRLELTLPPGAATGDEAWLLFEPAGGRQRLAVGRVELTETIAVSGLPEEAGEVALIRSAELLEAPTGRAASAPDGFEATWRHRAGPWYGALVSSGSEASRLELRTVRPGPAQAPIPVLSPTARVESGDAPVLALADGSRTEYRLEIGCGRGLSATAMGFGSLTTAGSTALPGESVELSAGCDAGQATGSVRLQVESFNRRPLVLLFNSAEAVE